jgi:hypothetical protein
MHESGSAERQGNDVTPYLRRPSPERHVLTSLAIIHGHCIPRRRTFRHKYERGKVDFPCGCEVDVDRNVESRSHEMKTVVEFTTVTLAHYPPYPDMQQTSESRQFIQNCWLIEFSLLGALLRLQWKSYPTSSHFCNGLNHFRPCGMRTQIFFTCLYRPSLPPTALSRRTVIASLTTTVKSR